MDYNNILSLAFVVKVPIPYLLRIRMEFSESLIVLTHLREGCLTTSFTDEWDGVLRYR